MLNPFINIFNINAPFNLFFFLHLQYQVSLSAKSYEKALLLVWLKKKVCSRQKQARTLFQASDEQKQRFSFSKQVAWSCRGTAEQKPSSLVSSLSNKRTNERRSQSFSLGAEKTRNNWWRRERESEGALLAVGCIELKRAFVELELTRRGKFYFPKQSAQTFRKSPAEKTDDKTLALKCT